MANLTQKLSYLVSVDSGGAVKGFKQVGQAASEALGKVGNSLHSLGDGATKAIAGGVGITLGMYSLARGASDVAESVNKVNVIYGEGAASIRKWSQSTASSLGLSGSAALASAGQLGAFGKAMGLSGQAAADFAMNATQLAVDLGSFNNTSAEDAITAIGAALRGESEPIRRYGVLLDDATLKARALKMGLISATKDALTPAQKATAAYAEILAQTTDAQGDFARTSDGFANSQKIFAASMDDFKNAVGKGALPVMTQLVKVGVKTTEMFNAIPDSILSTAGTIIAITGLAMTLGGVLLKVGLAVSHFVTMMKVAAAVTKITGFNMAPLATKLQLVGGAFGIAVTAGAVFLQTMDSLKNKQREVEARTKEVASALRDQVNAMLEVERAAGTVVTAADAQRVFGEALADSGEDGAKLEKTLGALDIQVEDVAATFGLFENGAKSAFTEILAGNDVLGKHKQAVIDTVAAKDKWTDIEDQLIQKGIDLTEEQWAQVRAMEELQDQYEKTDLNDIAQQFLNAEVAASDSKAAMVDNAEALAGVSREGEGAYQVYLKYVELLGKTGAAAEDTENHISDLGPAIDAVADAIKRTEEAYKDAQDAAMDFFGISLDLEEQRLAMQDAYNEWLWTKNAPTVTQAQRDAATAAGKDPPVGFTEREKQDAYIAVRKEALATKDAIMEYKYAEQGLTEQTATGNQKKEIQLAALRQLKMYYPELTAEIDAQIAALEAIPEVKVTDIQIDGADGSKQSIRQHILELDGISEEKRTDILTHLDEGDYAYVKRQLELLAKGRIVTFSAKFDSTTKGNNGGRARNASGTNNFPGGMTWVGERGPELLSLPSGSKIFSNPQSQRLAGLAGGGTGAVHITNYNNYFTVPPTADLGLIGQKLVEAIKAYERKSGKGWRS